MYASAFHVPWLCTIGLTANFLMKCARCSSEARGNGDKYCPDCRAAYQRNWRPLKKKLDDQAAFNRGVAGAREAIAAAFENIADLELNGRTAAAIARQCIVT
jgi:hypothetical protein